MRKIRLLSMINAGRFIVPSGTILEAHMIGTTRNCKANYRNIGFIIYGGDYEFV